MSVDPKDEAAQLAKARAGDRRALEELLAAHEKQLFRFGLRMCGSEDDAREVLQDTLLTAFRGLREFRGDAALSTWLYQIARSFCVKRKTRGAAVEPTQLPLDSVAALSVESDRPGPEAQAHAREVAQVIQAAILALPESAREVLVLRDVEGLSAEEAAGVIGIEVGALKSRLHRARAELRARVQQLLEHAGGHPDAQPPCPELVNALSAYAGQEIDQSTCQRIEEHLRGCRRCSAACEDLKNTISLCRHLPGDEVPGPIRAAVRRVLAAS